MVHSNSSSPMKTAPSASPHQTDLTSSADSTQVPNLAPADGKSPFLTTIKALSLKSSPASVGPSPQTPASTRGLVNGRTSGRKRTPKACDCCGPSSAGHNVVSSGRGRGTPRGRGRGRGRGGGRDLGDTPKRKVGQLTVSKDIGLTKKDEKRTKDERNTQEMLQVAHTPSQTPVLTAVQKTSQDGPIRNCAAPKKEVVQIQEDVSMPSSGIPGAVEEESGDEKDADKKLSGWENRGTGAVRGRGRGRGRGKPRTSSKIEVNIQIKGRGHDTSALAPSVSVEKQDSQMDQNDSDPVKCLFGNGNMVTLSDMDGEMDHSMIVCEPADELSVSLLSSPGSRLGSLHDLDSKMQVDQASDQTDQVSLSLILPNGNLSSPTDCDFTSVKVKTAVVPPSDPITVTSTEYVWALSDHKLYCQPGTWAKEEAEEMVNKNQAEEKVMDTDAQRKENLEQLIHTVHGKMY